MWPNGRGVLLSDTPSAILAAKTKQAPAQSNRNGGGVVVIEPLHSLAQAHLLPFTRDLLANAVLVGKARRKCARLVLARLAHNHRGALFADPLVSGERQVRLAEILVETGRNDITVLDRHHAALAQERQRRMAGIAEQSDAAFRPGRHRLADHHGPFVGRLDP